VRHLENHNATLRVRRFFTMQTSRNRTVVVAIVGIVIAALLVVGAYSLGARQAQPAPAAVVQVAAPEAAATPVAPSGWDTEWSQKIGVKLLQRFDSSGDPAWDPKEHPLVFITTVGPGYGGLLSGVTHPGVAIIDAYTRELVAYRAYDMGWEEYFEPHGLGVSPDGQWIYLPTGEGASFRTAKGRWLIINARTLKLDKVLASPGRPHHAKSFIDAAGNERVLAYGWDHGFYVFDPKDDNRVVGGATPADMLTNSYLYFVDPSGAELYATGREPGSVRVTGSDVKSIVTVIDTATWEVLEWFEAHDSTPIWVDFSADGKYAYVSGGHESIVVRYDREESKVTHIVRAGVEGPYGIRLNWLDNEIWTVGKGEGSHNRGKVLGLIDMTSSRWERGRASDQFYTGCVRGDHATLHPDPELNELWITCNSSFEIVVFDLDKREVKARIPMPEGGSTHSGAFVQYNPDFTGEVLSDQNGLHGSALQKKRELIAATASK